LIRFLAIVTAEVARHKGVPSRLNGNLAVTYAGTQECCTQSKRRKISSATSQPARQGGNSITVGRRDGDAVALLATNISRLPE
jgi:hypothetical protein